MNSNAFTPHSKDIRVAVTGASGRMGKTLIEAICKTPGFTLSGALDTPNNPNIGLDAGAFMGVHTGVFITSELAVGLANADALIDFTRPEGTLAHAAFCGQHGIKMVIGTTGFNTEQEAILQSTAQQIAVVLAPNMAVGVNACFKILELAATILSEGYDIEVIEAHHNQKVDAPSGTALRMGEHVAKALGVSLRNVGVFAREGITGIRKPGSIGFSTIRGGDIVGDHTVMFAGLGERIEITHKSSSRMTYAQGSLRAVRFLMQHQHGFFDMQDVLGLSGEK